MSVLLILLHLYEVMNQYLNRNYTINKYRKRINQQTTDLILHSAG
jgi:hypothetical protein